MKAAPSHLPPVYEIHLRRRVDVHGFVALHANIYSAPRESIGREVTLRETMHEVTILDGPRVLCTHPRIPEGERAMSRLDDHRWGRERRRWNKGAKQPEEVWLESRSPSLKMFLAELRRQVGRRYPYQVRQLYGLCHDYEATLVIPCVDRSMNYGLYDVSRLERMLLKEHGTKLFQLNDSRDEGPNEGRVTSITAIKEATPEPETIGEESIADESTKKEDAS